MSDSLPATNATALVRTDFSDPQAWADALAEIARPSDPDGFLANVAPVSDPRFEGLTPEQLLEGAPDSLGHAILIVADKVALSSPEIPLLIIGLAHERGRQFRVVARELWGVENNLSLANMDLADFADAVDPDGVFRAFRD